MGSGCCSSAFFCSLRLLLLLHFRLIFQSKPFSLPLLPLFVFPVNFGLTVPHNPCFEFLCTDGAEVQFVGESNLPELFTRHTTVISLFPLESIQVHDQIRRKLGNFGLPLPNCCSPGFV